MKKSKSIIKYLFYSVQILFCIYVVYFSLTNPELTNTQVLLELWYLFLLAIVIAVSGIFLKIGEDE